MEVWEFECMKCGVLHAALMELNWILAAGQARIECGDYESVAREAAKSCR